jgi:hypothetical protein
MRFLISGIKPMISVTTEIAPKGVGVARNYTTSTIRITTLTITFHVR